VASFVPTQTAHSVSIQGKRLRQEDLSGKGYRFVPETLNS
jgi:hypothetical protein